MDNFSITCQEVVKKLDPQLKHIIETASERNNLNWEEFSAKLKSTCSQESSLIKSVKGSHHYEIKIKLNDEFNLVLLEKKDFEYAFVFLVFKNTLRTFLVKMSPIEENIIPFTNLVDYCMDLCKEFHSKYSKAYRQRIAGLNLSEYDTFQCWYCGEVINPNGEKTKHCPVCGKSLKFPIAKVVKEVFLASIRSKLNSNIIT